MCLHAHYAHYPTTSYAPYLVAIPGLVAIDALRDNLALLRAVAETLVERVVLADPETAVLREGLQVPVQSSYHTERVSREDWDTLQ